MENGKAKRSFQIFRKPRHSRDVFVKTVFNAGDGDNEANLPGSSIQEGGSESPDLEGMQSEKENFLLAVTYMEDALYGRTLHYHTDFNALLMYRKYSNPIRQWITLFFMWFNLALAIFEDPAVPGAELKYWATMPMELICIGIFLVRMWRLTLFVPRSSLIHDPKNIVVMLTIAVTVVDMIVYVGMINSNASENAIRISRILRPLFLINMNESRQIRRAFRNIRNTIPEIFSVLVLFFFSIALFSLMAFKLFEERSLTYRTGTPYFKYYGDSYFDLYVLVTTANSPDVMMPAYDYSPWFLLFFITYIVVNTYIFMNLFLAVIYNGYRKHLKNEISVAFREKRKKLMKAFDLIKTQAENGEEHVSFETWNRIMKKISTAFGEAKSLLLWRAVSEVNSTESIGITRDAFLIVADALNVRLVTDASNENLFATHCSGCYYSSVSQFLIKCTNHRFFAWVFDVLILANAITIAFNLEKTEWFFLPAFMLEILARIYAVGPREFFSRDQLWNWFDFLIITAAFIVTVIEASLDELEQFPREALDVLLVLRCLRLVKIVGSIERFRAVVMTMANIAPSLLTYGGVLLMVYYMFAILGMEIFAGKLSFNSTDPRDCGNDMLIGTEFSRMGYCNINFNDIFHSLVTLFVLTVVNQWHVITEGYVQITGNNNATKIFFVAFHLIIVILILNIIVAFVLEAFILEYSNKPNEVENIIAEKISQLRLEVSSNTLHVVHDQTELISTDDVAGSETSTESQYVGQTPRKELQNVPEYRFRINKGHKNIEVLLQRLFEEEVKNEIEIEEQNSEQPQIIQDTTRSSSSL